MQFLYMKKKKFIERIIYNFLLNHFLRNKRFPLSQLGFTPEDLCISQLLSTIIEIQTVFDNNPAIDVRGVFLDISKTGMVVSFLN